MNKIKSKKNKPIFGLFVFLALLPADIVSKYCRQQHIKYEKFSNRHVVK